MAAGSPSWLMQSNHNHQNWLEKMSFIPEIFYELLFDYTLRTVALGSATLGLVSGALGTYAVLRKQSLLGDAISHAALPGIVLAFLVFRAKAPLILILGAVLAGWLGTLFIINIIRYTRINEDTAMGLVLSVFFGFGLMLLTYTQRIPDARQAGLDRFLFGQAAALLQSDIITMAGVGGMALVIMVLFWKEFKLLSFDPEFGASLGYPMRKLDILLTTLIVIAIVIGLQTVGVILMSAMVVAPAAAARQWTNRTHIMVLLSALFGALAGISGTIISSLAARIATGPTIVLSISVIVVFSLLFAPNRGLVWRWIKQVKNRHKLELDSVLIDLYTLASQHGDHTHSHSRQVIRAMHPGDRGTLRSLQELQKQRLVVEDGKDLWSLTSTGWKHAQEIVRERGVTQ
jgi:manganese/zinc/iron transport system permease protein